MGEHYNNLTLKTLFTLKYFLNTSNFIATPPKYLMKVDDDTFVNAPRLWNLLEYDKEWSQIPDLLMGYLMAKPQRNKWESSLITDILHLGIYFKIHFLKFSARCSIYLTNEKCLNLTLNNKLRLAVKDQNRKYTNKWICPEYMYNGKYYPQILSGSGYVMTRSVAKCLYETALRFPYFHLEDVLITGNQ